MTHYLSQCDTVTGCGKTYPSDLSKCPNCGIDQAFSSPAPLDQRDWGWDLETYPNVFTATWVHAATGLTVVHEISDRRNDWTQLVEFVNGLGRSGARGVGFNNLAFDYPVLHWIVRNVGCTVAGIYQHAMSIIKSDNKFGSMIWDSDMIFPQIDLYKICHFDNKAKSTSLKALEIVMRSRNVRDLPFPVGTMLNDAQKDVLLSYNKHDVNETLKFMMRILPAIHLREKLSEKYKCNMMNFSNTKIGATILVSQMEKAGIECYIRGAGGKRPRQTIRTSVAFKDVIFPYISFERPEFNHILELFKSKSITSAEINDAISGKLKTKGVFKDLNVSVEGFEYVFGVGGIHGSIESQIVYSDDEFLIEDADVTSFYPRTAIVNRMYPEHLGDVYCDIYNGIFDERTTYPKGTPENAALKEALNASYGNSNNAFSPLFDPKYTMMTTINGQLMLCMLAEQLLKIPKLTMIQANTDGITYRCPRVYLDHARKVCEWWEQVTGLNLEYAHYSRMLIRDVNNYIAEYATFEYLVNGEWVRKVSNGVKPDSKREVIGATGGKLKRKGAYEYNTQWHQDPSALVVPMAAEAALVRGEDIAHFIKSHTDPFDFMLRAKVPRASKLVMRWPEWDAEQELQHITRYFISRNGGSLVKVSPPTGEPGTWKRKAKVPDELYHAVLRELAENPPEWNGFYEIEDDNEREMARAEHNVPRDSAGIPWDARIHTGNKSKHDTREMSVNAGWRVTECADAADFNWSELNYDWYIEQARKLVDPLVKVV